MDDIVSLPSPITPTSPVNTSSPVGLESQQQTSGKVCGVCGDKALGCNFNAITCESCKAFFRRNALKEKEFRCPFENNCKIDPVTRRFCQKCRLKKCFSIGMKKEFIMSEEERTVKRRKIEENRMKKKSESKTNGKPVKSTNLLNRNSDIKSEAESSYSDSDIAQSPLDNSPENHSDGRPICKTSLSGMVNCAESCSLKTSINAFQAKLKVKDVDRLVKVPSLNLRNGESKIANNQLNDLKFLLTSSFNGTNNVMGVLGQNSKQLDVDQSTMDTLLNIAIRAEYNAATDLVRGSKVGPISPVRDRQLNELECAKLQELVIANKALLAPLNEDGPIKQSTGDTTLLNVINLTDIAIRRIIKMAKKLSAFKTLCQEDQIALLKGGCTELMILRSVVSYDADKGCWKIPHTDSHMNHIKVEVLKEARGNLYEQHQRFIHSFEPSWRSDEQIILLLSAIALFEPQRPNVVHKDAIKLEQESYYYLLRRYLESIFGGCEARSIFLKLIQKVSELHILNENHVRVYLDANPKEVEPLLIEIFDLKSR